MNKTFEPVFKQLDTVILGKQALLKQLIACVLAGGHVLLEDVPGVGKTTLASANGGDDSVCLFCHFPRDG